MCDDNTPNGQEAEDYGYEIQRQRRIDAVVPASCQLNQAFIDRVKRPLRQVWNGIAADMFDDEEISNENVIEYCTDADHLLLIADDAEANDLVHEQIKIHGYTRVLKFLSKNIQLL